MMTIKRVTVSGKSAKGNFSGTIEFKLGLQIVSASNKYGKSLITSAIAWCLNLESLYGYTNSDNSIFQGGILERVDLGDDLDVPVENLKAEIELATGTNSVFRIARPVVGGDRKVIEVNAVGPNASSKRINLITGFGSFGDASAGFQAWLFATLGLPSQRVLNKDGAHTNLYFENIAPLFFIEQIKGWMSIQSRQIYRYRIEEITSVAFEYVLGLDSKLRQRLKNQEFASQEVSLRFEIITLIKQFIQLLEENGWADPRPTTNGSLDHLYKLYSRFRFADYLKEHFSYSHTNENKLLVQAKSDIQRKINEGFIEESNRATFSELSSRLLELRQIHTRRNGELSILRSQRLNQQDVLKVLGARLASAKDLRRLKALDIGDIHDTECPTCHRAINADDLHVFSHTLQDVDVHIESLEKEIQLVKGALEKIEDDIKSQMLWVRKTDEELSSVERKIALISNTIGSAKTALVKLSFDLTNCDKNIEKNNILLARIEKLQEALAGWASKASAHQIAESDVFPDQSARLETFTDELRTMLAAVGHGALSNREPKEVYVDNAYNPCIRSRQVERIGSASDRARLVLAYVLALLRVSVRGGHHPGFVVLDEPLQQNPDPLHRGMTVELLQKRWPEEDGQILVFTNVQPIESKRLRAVGAPLIEITEKRFLRLVLSLPAK